MKRYFFILFLGFTSAVFGQQIDYNEQNNFVANGYDVIAYFSNNALKGSSKFEYKYDSADYRFSSLQNLESFKSNPKKYVPQYGGWCAYAMADKGEKVSINPKTFEIRNGKLYLFYNAYFNNTFESWIEESPLKLISKANVNWNKIKFKS
jgi:YHS domain-containing protein